MKTEVIDEGQAIVLFKDSYEIRDCADLSPRCVVGKCPNGIDATIMKDKKNMAHQGMLIVAGAINEASPGNKAALNVIEYCDDGKA